jgi:hypothetical protein
MLLRPRMGAVVLQPPLLKVIPTLISTRPDRLVAHPWTTTVNQGCPAARIGTYFFIGMIRYDCLSNSGLPVFRLIIPSRRPHGELRRAQNALW